MASILGLSHVGVFVKDLEKMTAFYRDVLGLEESHRIEGRGVFLTANKEREDHEIVLFQGRDGDAHIIQQISFRVRSVEDVRAFYQAFHRLGVPIQQTVSHGAGVSCYFSDPEGNRAEVFADVPVKEGRGYAGPLDLDRTAEELIAQVKGGVGTAQSATARSAM